MKTKLFLTAALVLSLFAASTAQTLPAYLPTDGLVGWWPFNGNATDESGNGNDGLVNGAVLTEDRFGDSNKAYSFNGIDNSINCGNGASLNNFTEEISVSVWVKAPEGIDPNNNILSKYGCNPGGWSLETGFGVNFTGCGQNALSQNNFYNATWCHIVGLKENNQWKVYLNSVLLVESIIYPNYNLNSVYDLIIGVQNDNLNPDVYWDGEIDDIAIYNRALTTEEITALYTGEPANPPAACNPLPSNLQNGLVGYWPFCGNANDESGNGNNGTVNGATLTEDRFGVANAAYDFDGVSNSIRVPNNNSLQTPNGISINTWVKFNPVQQQNSRLTSKGWSPNAIEVHIEPNILNRIRYGGSFNGGGYGPISQTELGNNIWFMVTAIDDGNSKYIYINGVMEDSLNHNFNGLPINSVDLFMGKNSQLETDFLNGSLDDIGIWNRALTADEVQQLYTLNACTFTIYDTTNITIYDTVSVSVSTTDTLIINTLITAVEPAQENTFLVYPNPASTQITINNGNVAILGGYTMRISNSLGQDVYNQNITQPQVTLDLSTWGGNGLYVLYIVDPQQNIVAVKQIVLQ